jgi:hypothetical protein
MFNVMLEFGHINVPGLDYPRVTRGVNIALAAGAPRSQVQLQVDLAIKAQRGASAPAQLD